MGTMKTLAREGDLKMEWNVDKEDEVKAAKEIFEKKLKEKWSAFEDKGKGTKGCKITEFNKYAKRIILVPPISGGYL